jgi:ribosomal-protein-alanine N-acetyltransferase
METGLMYQINTERLIIRNFKPEDWKDLYEYLSDPTVVKFEPYEVFTEEQCHQEAVRRSNQESFLAVCLKGTGKLIGNIYFEQQEPKVFSTWEIGYVFNLKYQGHGYATESCRAIISNGVKNLGTRRVVAMCDPNNGPSWKLLERLGFRREGHLLKNVFFKVDEKNGPIWKDTFEYAILSEEWKSGNKQLIAIKLNINDS